METKTGWDTRVCVGEAGINRDLLYIRVGRCNTTEGGGRFTIAEAIDIASQILRFAASVQSRLEQEKR